MGSARRAHSSSPEDWVPSALRLHYSTSSREAEYPVQEHLTQEPKAQRAAASNSYSVWEMVVGPDRSDLALVNMPAELEEIAQRLLQSTRRSRKARLTILQALVRSYDAYRHQQRSSASSGASGIKKGAHGTVSEYMQRITSVAAILAESEVDYKTVVAALLCQSPLSLEEVERDFGKSVSTIIRGFQRMLEIENILEIRGLIQDYPKRLMGQEGDNLRNLLLSVAQDWRAVALRGE
jgi:AraC-like DNA-binding protein